MVTETPPGRGTRSRRTSPAAASRTRRRRCFRASTGRAERADAHAPGRAGDDLAMSRSHAQVRTESPRVYRNDGRGQFRAMSPVPFAGSDRWFGWGAVLADVNGDGAVDFVLSQRNNGPDRHYGTTDDFATLVTLLNTTPAGPRPGLRLWERCRLKRCTWATARLPSWCLSGARFGMRRLTEHPRPRRASPPSACPDRRSHSPR